MHARILFSKLSQYCLHILNASLTIIKYGIALKNASGGRVPRFVQEKRVSKKAEAFQPDF